MDAYRVDRRAGLPRSRGRYHADDSGPIPASTVSSSEVCMDRRNPLGRASSTRCGRVT